MHVDPRLNCAAEICCGPDPLAKGVNEPAHAARVQLLEELGADPVTADRVSVAMAEKGIVFLSAELATAIRHIAFP